MGYAELNDLPAMNAAIDEAAQTAGRSPTQIRRLYNITGTFDAGSGFLQGSSQDWAEQLCELTMTQGMSTYILNANSDDDIRRFGTEVVPAVRALVDAERGHAERPPTTHRASEELGASLPARTPFAVVPTPDPGLRLSADLPWDERARPTGPVPDSAMLFTGEQQATGQHLIDVHDALRGELERLRDVIEQVVEGSAAVATARSFIYQMTIRQNSWTLGAFCASYCRIVSSHHMLEDRSVFPHLKQRDPRLVPVVDRLEEEHLAIADVLEQVDRALVAVVTGPNGMGQLRIAVDMLTDTLLSHLSYEERELIEPLARLGF
jgi:iron-sulfur cluster repair protein YtfE (RIC family)